MILGAAAYRLAKQRRLGLQPSSSSRQVVELVLLVLVFVPTLIEAFVRDGILHTPLASVVIPIASVTAYLVVRHRKAQQRGGPTLDLTKG